MTLLQLNMAAMTVVCLCLLVGFSYRDTRFSGPLMLAGALGLMGLIVYNIRTLSVHT